MESDCVSDGDPVHVSITSARGRWRLTGRMISSESSPSEITIVSRPGGSSVGDPRRRSHSPTSTDRSILSSTDRPPDITAPVSLAGFGCRLFCSLGCRLGRRLFCRLLCRLLSRLCCRLLCRLLSRLCCRLGFTVPDDDDVSCILQIRDHLTNNSIVKLGGLLLLWIALFPVNSPLFESSVNVFSDVVDVLMAFSFGYGRKDLVCEAIGNIGSV